MPPMRFNDGAADSKSHASAMKFGGEECVKDPVWSLGKAHASVTYRYCNLLLFRSLRLDHKLAPSVHLFHCLNAVDDEVHNDLLQLNAIPHDLENIFRQHRLD